VVRRKRQPDDEDLAREVFLICFLGSPGAFPAPPREIRDDLAALLSRPPTIPASLAAKDRLCLAITKVALDRLPEGRVDLHATGAVRLALALVAWCEPEILERGGIATREERATVRRDKRAALDVGVARTLRYREWFADVLAMKKPRDAREAEVQELFQAMLPLPTRDRIKAALSSIAERVARYQRGRCGVSEVQCADDLVGVLWERGPKGALYIHVKRDGSKLLCYDEWKVAEAFRRQEWGGAAPARTAGPHLVRRVHEEAPADRRLRPVSLDGGSDEKSTVGECVPDVSGSSGRCAPCGTSTAATTTRSLRSDTCWAGRDSSQSSRVRRSPTCTR
jgi:hypothetical protein